MKTTSSQSVSWPATTVTSPAAGTEIATRSLPGNVVWLEFPEPDSVGIPDDFDDIDAVIEDIEATPAGHTALDDARRFVGREFYANQAGSLAAMRLAKGWSQKRLAEEASTSQPYVARLEKGNADPQLSTARRICEALGISIEQFDRAFKSNR